MLGTFLTSLLIPPENLLPLGLLGLAMLWRCPRTGRLLVGISLGGLFLFSLPVVSMLLVVSLESGLARHVVVSGPDAPEAIVILSGDAGYGAAGGIDPGSGIGPLTLERMRAGAELARRTGLPILTTGGPMERGATPIATLMARSLQEDFATPVRWVEPAAGTTWQNAAFSARLLARDNIRRVYVVSNAWHLRRARIAFADAGLVAVPAGIRFGRWPRLDVDAFLPHASSLQRSYFAMHEWIGYVVYRLRGHAG
ncbi:MAG: YdcF family protein [Rhodospirillales bacterium]|nr:YdcF family protein [Rhodospirillales bacterium]MDE2199763.1 YdcF family protein [Rhodospirillales bacterium]MDE2576920.1 YdcF family protein [Rhodospirillales bacterium]